MPGVEHIDVIRGNIGDFISGGEGGEVTIVNAGNGNPGQSLLAGLSGVADALHAAVTTAYGLQTADRVMGSPEGGQAGSVQIVHASIPTSTMVIPNRYIPLKGLRVGWPYLRVGWR